MEFSLVFQRILHSDMKLFVFKVSVLHILFEYDKQRRLQFAAWADEQNAALNNTWFSDEIVIWMGLVINRICASAQDNTDTTVVQEVAKERKCPSGYTFPVKG
jgi:hypothetical protein